MPDSHRRPTGTTPDPTHRRAPARVLIALLLVLAGVLTMVQPAAAAPRKARSSYPRAIEPLARYQPQTMCSPRAKPGVSDLAARLLRAYPGTRSLGIVRACAAGGRSEHKEGRAFDWGGLRASRAADRAKVQNFATWLFATDRHGNKRAMARRLGIQYVIWNKRIWGSYAASSGWRRYTGANPHTDHVHISFTWAGANKRTSFWTGKVGNVAAAPKPPPRSVSIPKPRPQPVAPATLPSGLPVTDEIVNLPANAAGGRIMTGALVADQPYLIEASGTFTYARNAKADAECSRTAADSTWRRDRSVHRLDPVSDHLDLYVDGVDLLAQADSGYRCDTTNHVYRWMYTPRRSGRVTFKIWDPTTLRDNAGSLTMRVIKSAPADTLSWSVSSRAGAGRMSPGALEAGETYLATVTGVVDTGGAVLSDAECTATTRDSVWRRQRSVVDGDDFDVLVDRRDVTGEPASQPDPDERCDPITHSYSWVLRPQETRPVNVRVDDPSPRDNSGSLLVQIVRQPRIEGTEQLDVDTSDPAGATTARVYPAGQTMLVRVSGTYAIAPGVTADAECSVTGSDQTWRSSRPELAGTSGQPLGDLTVNGQLPDWTPVSGSYRCDRVEHTYRLRWTPQTTGPLVLAVVDERHTDNAGTLSVTIEPAG